MFSLYNIVIIIACIVCAHNRELRYGVRILNELEN